MLGAMQADPRFEGLYGNDGVTQGLEATIARLTGCEAALFVPSSTLGNYLALRSLVDPLLSTLFCDARSRIARGQTPSLVGVNMQRLSPMNQIYLTEGEIKKQIIRDEHEVHSVGDVSPWQTHIVSCENTLAGVIMPLEEVQRISEFARRYGIRLHLDGARVWEAVAAGAGSLTAYCSCFDVITLSFSKGLGAPGGGMLAGDTQFIAQARQLMRGVGGEMKRANFLSATCTEALNNSFGLDSTRTGFLLAKSHSYAARIARYWTEQCRGTLKYPVETNVVWLAMLDDTAEAFKTIAKQESLLVSGGRLMMHSRKLTLTNPGCGGDIEDSGCLCSSRIEISVEALTKLEWVLQRLVTLDVLPADTANELNQ